MIPSKKENYKCVVIDDDQMSIDILGNYIKNIAELSLFKTYTNPASAITEIKLEDEIDFLFLDISMDISGLDVARVLRNKVQFLVFVTSYDEYALDAFGVNGDKFLVKPISFQKLQTAVSEVLNRENRRAGLI